MKLNASQMKDIYETASTGNYLDSFGIDIGDNYHFYIEIEILNNKFYWIIEPNKLDEDVYANPCGEKEFVTIENIPYSNYAELLIACEELAEKYFIEE